MSDVLHVVSSWEAFCNDIKQLGLDVLALAPPDNASQAAEAFAYTSKLMRAALDYRLDGGDALRPRLHWWDRLSAGAAPVAPNIDNSYLLAQIDGRRSYRLTIDTKSIDELNVSAHSMAGGVYDLWGDANLRDLKLVDGRAEIILSGTAHPENWIEIPPHAEWLFLRLYYFDWERSYPPVVTLEDIGWIGDEAETPSPEVLMRRLLDTVTWQRQSMTLGKRWMDSYIDRLPARNIFSPAHTEPMGARCLIYGGAVFELEPDEALVMTFEPPPGQDTHWTVQWHRLPWGDSADFMRHITSLNKRQARVDSDGKIRIVFAHEDPHVQNWISTEHRRNGFILYRWMWADVSPLPIGEVFKLTALPKALPTDTPIFDEAARARQMQVRRRHLSTRY